MILSDRHTHTTYSDGRNTPEEMIIAAIDKGMRAIGLSDHSYTSFDLSDCMKPENIVPRKEEIRALQQKYSDQIEVLLGIEQDLCSDFMPEGYDYVIGSVHYVRKDGACLPVDWSKDRQQEIIDTHYRGDFYSFAEDYFASVSLLPEKTNCDIIGHFDLVSVFSEEGIHFDPENSRYISAWKAAAESILTARPGMIFEINTGAISRGHRSFPYPSAEMIRFIRSCGGRFELSSDSHTAENLLYGFDRFAYLLNP